MSAIALAVPSPARYKDYIGLDAENEPSVYKNETEQTVKTTSIRGVIGSYWQVIDQQVKSLKVEQKQFIDRYTERLEKTEIDTDVGYSGFPESTKNVMLLLETASTPGPTIAFNWEDFEDEFDDAY